MKKLFGVLGSVLLLAGVVFWGQVAAKGEAKILEFDTMAGLPRAYVLSSGNDIRGVQGGGLPWVIGSAEGELRVDGQIEVQVEGLVFDPNDPVVIERGLANKNPIPAFRAVVSCLTVDDAGNAATVTLQTEPFPATTGDLSEGAGNAMIEDQLDLPQPCIAPIVFVTSPTGLWFSSTGF